MLTLEPVDARYLHEGHAITREQRSAIERAGALAMAGDQRGAARILAGLAGSAKLDPTTPLDVAALTSARERTLRAIAGARSIARAASAIDALSLAPRDVSAHAERIIAVRARRIERLVAVGAPGAVVTEEARLIAAAVRRLDRRVDEDRARTDDEHAYLPQELPRLADPRFDLSLGTLSAVLDAAWCFHGEAGRSPPMPALDELASGAELVALPDLEGPPQALFERAILERGEWDERHERDLLRQRHLPWLDWHVDERAEEIDETVAAVRQGIAEIPEEARREISATIECAVAPYATCEDWFPVLDARLVALARATHAAVAAGLVIVSRVHRSLSY